MFLGSLGLGISAWTVPGAFAEALLETPSQTEGPFYPNHLPLDTDNDLILVNDSLTPAVGEVTHLSGRILDRRGDPIRNALVEIWQVDRNGVYLHTDSPDRRNFDPNFQGFGRFLTGSKGEYYFRTIKPVPYAPSGFQRTPHIHMAVKIPGRDKFTTQCYIRGEPSNEKDFVLKDIRDPQARESVMVDFEPLPDTQTGELAARFDVVLGFTPEG
jgi:protocatechuate 3,4-dioxygenase beta subunit